MKLSEQLKAARTDRPDEFQMDVYIQLAIDMELVIIDERAKYARLSEDVYNLRKSKAALAKRIKD